MNINVGNLIIDKEYGVGIVTEKDKNDRFVTIEWPDYKAELKLFQLEVLLKFDRVQLIQE